ncbi:RNA-binding cell division protein [Clostridia bacterium]|nr:RNA-binding cell division protein [Clostridia bacterium]
MLFQDDNGILIAKIKDAIRFCETRRKPSFVGFLNEHQAAASIACLKHEKVFNYKFYGGCKDSDRTMLVVYPQGNEIGGDLFPISALCFTYPKEYKLTHRDFLGALMALGLKRETIGDILTENGKAVTFVKNEIKDYIITQVDKIGAVRVTVTEAGNENFTKTQLFDEFSCTVASLRLDGIVAAITKQSREKSVGLIECGLVAVNAVVVYSPSSAIKVNSKISVRGKGKFIISEVCGETKKGRLRLIIKEYR